MTAAVAKAFADAAVAFVSASSTPRCLLSCLYRASLTAVPQVMERLRRLRRRMRRAGDLADGAEVDGPGANAEADAAAAQPRPEDSRDPGAAAASGGAAPSWAAAAPRSGALSSGGSSQCAQSRRSGWDDDATSVEQRLAPGGFVTLPLKQPRRPHNTLLTPASAGTGHVDCSLTSIYLT